MPNSVYSFSQCNLPAFGTAPRIVGISPVANTNSVREGETTSQKAVLTKAFQKANRAGVQTEASRRRSIGGFRFYNNAGDPLSRNNYSGVENTNQCRNQLGGGVGKMHSPRCRRGRSQINTSGVETFSGNPRYVYDSSNYMTYKKNRAMNKGYATEEGLVYTEGGGTRCETTSAKNRVRK